MSSNNKRKKYEKRGVNGKKIIDLTSYISPEMVQSDPNGSYTGVTADEYFNNEYNSPVQETDEYFQDDYDDIPVQDADDL